MITKQEYLKAIETIRFYVEQVELNNNQFVNDFILTDKPIERRYINSIRDYFQKDNVYMSDIVKTVRSLNAGRDKNINNFLLTLRNFGMKGLFQVDLKKKTQSSLEPEYLNLKQ